MSAIVEIPAIYEEDLQKVLEKLGVLHDILQGKVKCFICEKEINLDNFGGIVKIKGNLKIVCDNPACIEAAIEISKALQGSK
ncbi:hypothetical protein DRP04_08050 [Archaeoglobales archaeon]|nr:MAG: hypothetical protein DRP04_08050 [Archaeoglobales archaeon]